MARDFYQILGVTETASQDEIKKQFRKLAKQHHPDRNKGDKSAEAKFKEISEAYDTLSDDKKRAEYDTLRRYGAFSGQGGPQGGFDPTQFRRGNPGSAGEENWEEILSQFFGGDSPFTGGGSRTRRRSSRQMPPQPGRDIEAEIIIPFMEAVTGTTRIIQVGSKKLNVRIPAGIDDNGRIRLAGQGEPGVNNGHSGDLLITVHLSPDPYFTRKGDDIYSSIEIPFTEAILGAKRSVRTLTKTVTLTIPPGTQPGAMLRLKGQGINANGTVGDQYVEVKVTIPKNLTDKQKKMIEEWEG
ncbi:MAG: J domain-containing protein [bacterium]|nr:J domain-containing protein [bacterium]